MSSGDKHSFVFISNIRLGVFPVPTKAVVLDLGFYLLRFPSISDSTCRYIIWVVNTNRFYPLQIVLFLSGGTSLCYREVGKDIFHGEKFSDPFWKVSGAWLNARLFAFNALNMHHFTI